MKKFYTLIAAVALFCTSASATTFTFQSNDDLKQTAGGFTIEISKASGQTAPQFYNEMRLYASNTITVSGDDITSIQLTFTRQGSKDYATLTATPGTLTSGGESTSNTDYVTDVWSGSAGSVTFTLGSKGQRVLTKIVVNGDGSETPDPDTPDNPDPDPDTPGDLNPDYTYGPVETIGVPSTTVQGDAYSFISSNIQVSCSKGAITDSYFSAHAGYDMTFTATKPIKGIVINGFVKKGFEATSTKGEISYLSPSEDATANPVVVITDINSTSVTISCVKQLRCYEVEVYFDENPDATVTGGNGGSGETIDLTYDTADAVYEMEYTDLYGLINYSIYLYNEAEYDPYFAFDIYPEEVGRLEGTYTWDDYTMGDFTYYVYGAGEDDIVWAEGGYVTISKDGDIYTIDGSVVGENGNTYNVYFQGKMPVYTDDEYYGGEDGGGDSGVEEIPVGTIDNADAPRYDLQGRKVGEAFRGIYIRNGRKSVAF